MPKRKLEQVTEHITKHLERYVALEACFDAADIKTPPTQPGQFAVSSLGEAETAAVRLCGHWQVGTAPIANRRQSTVGARSRKPSGRGCHPPCAREPGRLLVEGQKGSACSALQQARCSASAKSAAPWSYR